jgi:hypothetical protein
MDKTERAKPINAANIELYRSHHDQIPYKEKNSPEIMNILISRRTPAAVNTRKGVM